MTSQLDLPSLTPLSVAGCGYYESKLVAFNGWTKQFCVIRHSSDTASNLPHVIPSLLIYIQHRVGTVKIPSDENEQTLLLLVVPIKIIVVKNIIEYTAEDIAFSFRLYKITLKIGELKL